MSVRERESHRHILPGQRPERPLSPTQRDWKTVQTTIKNNFREDLEMLRLFRRKKPFFKEFFMASRELDVEKKPGRFQTLQAKYLNEPSLPTYNPDLFNIAGPILKGITAETVTFSKRGIANKPLVRR